MIRFKWWVENLYIQSVESAGFAFVGGANVRNYKFEKNIHVQTLIYDEQARTNKLRYQEAQGRTDFRMNTIRWQTLGVSLVQ